MTNDYEYAKKALEEIFDVAEQIRETGINIDNLGTLAEEIYYKNILPIELQNREF